MPEEECTIIKEFLESEQMPWFLSHGVARAADGYNYWTHTFVEDGEFSPFFDLVTPLLLKLEIKKIVRAKANLYLGTDKIIEHPPHIDYIDKNHAAVYSINTCDGYTRVGDEILPSVANRISIFDGTLEHNSTTCTDQFARININLNWTE